MKGTIFCDITLSIPLKVTEVSEEHIASIIRVDLFFNSEYVPPKRRLTLNGLHGVMSQKRALFITECYEIYFMLVQTFCTMRLH
jgi:hypothetical protein